MRQPTDEIIERVKGEILSDVLDRIVPAGITDFGGLQSHVDANCYGGLCDDESNADVGLDEFIIIQSAVDEWLHGGALVRATTITVEELTEAIRRVLPGLGDDGTATAGAVAFLEDPGGWVDQLGLMGEEAGEVSDLDQAVAARAIEIIQAE